MKGEGDTANENAEEDDSFLINQTLDSSALSGCESDSTVGHGSPQMSNKRVANDDNIPGSPLSPIVDDEESDLLTDACDEVADVRDKPQVQPLSLVTSSSPRTTPHRRLTPHTIDSFIFSPPPLRLPPYGLPPSPLTLPMGYIGFPPFHHPLSPRTPTGGSPFSLDMKPII